MQGLSVEGVLGLTSSERGPSSAWYGCGPGFPFCGVDDETIDNLWLQCSISRVFWFGQPFSLRVDVFFDLETIAWRQTSSYVLWEARNKQLFKGSHFSCETSLQGEVALAWGGDPAAAVVRPGIELQTASWQRPRESVFMLNFDVSFRSGEEGGLRSCCLRL